MKKIILMSFISLFLLSPNNSKASPLDVLGDIEFQCKAAQISSKTLGYATGIATFIAATHCVKKIIGVKNTKNFLIRNAKKIIAISASIAPSILVGKQMAKISLNVFYDSLGFNLLERSACLLGTALKN